MKSVSDYQEIVPGRKWFETFVTRVFFFFVGMGMQTAYRIDPDVKKEVDSWPETFSFRNFMERLVLSFAASCTASDVEFTSRLQENLPVITGDPVKLRQAILNLLKNARESIHGPGSVRLDVWSKCDELHIRIEDTGCGIPKQALSKLGRPFEQVQNQFTKTHKGSGLGLAIARSLVELHGGAMTIESTAGVGTRVALTFPRQRPEAEVDAA